jgi:hypothetical protein
MSANDHMQPQQFYHGTAHEFAPDDMPDPSHELDGKSGRSYAYMTADAQVARSYGRYKAEAQRFIGNEEVLGRAYEVTPTGPVERDETVDRRFAAWRSVPSSMTIVRDVTQPESELGQ